MSEAEDLLVPEDHPLYSPRWLTFETEQVSYLRKQIQMWIYTGVTGAIVVGNARTGKTTAMERIRKDLTNLRNNETIKSHVINIPVMDVGNVSNTLRALHRSIGENPKTSLRVEHIRTEVLEYFTDMALSHNTNLVLFIDEFQRLKMKQIEVFADLQNEMALRGATLTALFFGNLKQSRTNIESSSLPEYDHLRGRFFNQVHNFSGLRSREEVKKCLKCYDSLRFPVDSGPTYTEWFLPSDFQNGFRLENLASSIWKVFSGMAMKSGFKSWPMFYFINTINPLLINYLPHAGVGNYCDDMVIKCIDVSGIFSPSFFGDFE